MHDWPIELPLIFVEYIRSKKLDSYKDPQIKKEIEQYLNEITKDIAIPRLMSVIEGENEEEIILALSRIEELSNKNIEMVIPIKPYLENLINKNNKDIVSIAKRISNNFIKAEILYCLRYEPTPHLIDVFCRRTEMSLWIDHKKAFEAASKVVEIMANEYSWDENKKKQEIESYMDYIKKSVSFIT